MRFVSLVALSTAAIALMGCPSESASVDTDKLPSLQAPRVPPDLQVEDALDAKKDKIDYKILQPTEAGKAQVKVAFGEGHLVRGSMAVYGSDGATSVEEVAITGDEATYAIEWDVAQDAIYYLKLQADQGKGGYKVDFTVIKPTPKGPCDGVTCDEDQECNATSGKCEDIKPPECEPKCKAGLACVNGSCEKPCGGSCKRGELCNRTSNKCYVDPCFEKKCAAGEKCQRGTCVATAPVAKECTPACTGTAKCNTTTGKCEGGTDAPPVETPPVDNCAGPLTGAVVQLLPQGAKTVLVINRGSKVCVKVGQTGKLAGVGPAFKITEVYEFRSKAIIDVDDKTIGANRGVTINR